MQKTPEEKISSIKTSFRSMSLFILSVACFIVFLWTILVIVRFFAGLGAA